MVFQYGKSKGQNVSGIVKEEMFFLATMILKIVTNNGKTSPHR